MGGLRLIPKKGPDTIAFIYQGITDKGQLIILDEEYITMQFRKTISSSDIPARLIGFLERNRKKWGFTERCIY